MDLMEEREELMVFPTEKDRTLIQTHYLKPYVTSKDGGFVANLPLRRRLHSVSSLSDLKDSFSTISFNGFWSANDDFKSWAAKMETLHEPIWRKAGIYEAIKASIYKILKNESLILALAEKWCPETKSFVFPWGEATITLEDVMLLLGFSVLGSPVFSPLESLEMRDSVEKLEKVRQENMNTSSRVSQEKWSLVFRNSRDDYMEHEAFLALWLSHFVFPDKSRRSISRNVLPIAVRLARGEKVALATPVLASLYRDLGQIRDKSTRNVNLKSLFKLVQVWAWERFKNIRPMAKEIPRGEPRISQWGGLQKKTKKVRLNLDDFDWRPYTKPLKNWSPRLIYVEDAMWVTIHNKIDDEFIAFARCVRSSQLVGIGFVEDYYPNRVAMQFGLAQDLPGLVTHHSDFTEKEAWDDYNKSLEGLMLYMPSRLATTSVTVRYRDWWFKSVSKFYGFEESNETFNTSHSDDDCDVSPNVLSLCQARQKLREGFPAKLKRCRTRRISKNPKLKIKKGKIGDSGGFTLTEMSISPLFQNELVKKSSEHLRNKRCKQPRDEEEEEEDDDEDNITIAQIMKSREKSGRNGFESLGKRTRLEEVDIHNDLGICQMVGSKDEEEIGNKTILVLSDENLVSDSTHVASNGVVDVVDDERLTQSKLKVEELILNLEERIMKVERNLEKIREWKTSRNQIQTRVSD